MKEYIEKAAALEALSKSGVTCNMRAHKIVASIQAADVVEVVRCKDCIWRGREECAMFYCCDCGEQHTRETDNDFCSYGERRDENA